MGCKCVYRLTNQGEICVGDFSPLTGLVTGVPQDILEVKFNIGLNQLIGERGLDYCSLGIAEYWMSFTPNARLAFDFHPNLVPLIKADGNIYCISTAGTETVYNSASFKVDKSLIEVGYRPTKVHQVLGKANPYTLVYSRNKGVFITQDGLLKPEFDINELSKISKYAVGYKELVTNRNKYYALVYLDGKPRFLIKHDNSLCLQEV